MSLTDVFCDWISCVVPVADLPVLGHVLWLDGDGQIVRDVPRTQEMHRTSASTMFKLVQVSDSELYVDGNLGRWNRHDNLFGYSVAETVAMLPAFLTSKGITVTGAPRLTRVDITENLLVGSGTVSRFTHWAAGQRLGRHKPTLYETGVAWGLGSKWWSAKIYDKGADLRRSKKTHLAGLIGDGIARREITLRQKELEKMGLTDAAEWLEGTEQLIMNCKFRVLDKGGASVEQLPEMPLRIQNALHAWRNGKDFVAAYRERQISQATLYRLRREVLDASGVDIFQPADVLRLPVKVVEINPVRLTVPDWYEEYTRVAA